MPTPPIHDHPLYDQPTTWYLHAAVAVIVPVLGTWAYGGGTLTPLGLSVAVLLAFVAREIRDKRRKGLLWGPDWAADRSGDLLGPWTVTALYAIQAFVELL